MLYDSVFNFQLTKPLITGNYILKVSEFGFNEITVEGEATKYNFNVKGETSDGRYWQDTIFPNEIKNSKNEVTGNGFSIFLKNVQRQLAPNEDWTPPKTKAKLDVWIAKLKATIEGAQLSVSVVQRDYRKNGQLRTVFNKQYYQTVANESTTDDPLTF